LKVDMRRTGITGWAGRFALAGALAVVAFGALAVAGVAGTATPGGQPATAAFRLGDGSVACDYVDGRVACSAVGRDSAVVLEPDGSSHEGDVADVAWDDSTPVLVPGESWWNGDVSCVAGEDEITCSAADGVLHVSATGAGGVG
jgi:hypothetical protein